MIKVPYFQQINDHYCGPATLQMVFSFLGHTTDQKVLAKEMETSQESGTHNEKMIELPRKYGYDIHSQKHATIEDLKKYVDLGLPVIINHLDTTEDEGHFVVVVGYDENNIVVNDPWPGSGHEVPKDFFLKEWKERDNWLLVIKKTGL